LLNYLANIPKVIDLAKETKRRLPECFVFAGGHSASFTAKKILAHAEGAIACVVRGEGEAVTPQVLEAAREPGRLNGDSRRHKHLWRSP
jgi:hopanoid C-3 methylase